MYHIDEGSVAALTQYYRRTIKSGSNILDICSSWVSHYPLEFKDTMASISGTGMNAFELRANAQLTGESPGVHEPAAPSRSSFLRRRHRGNGVSDADRRRP